jgi:hypothetical protein
MTPITSAQQTGTAVKARVRTARPAKLKSSASVKTVERRDAALPVDSDCLAPIASQGSDATLVPPVVLPAVAPAPQATEKLLLELDELWADVNTPVDAYMRETQICEFAAVSNEQSLLNRLSDISKFYTGTGCEIAEKIETELNEDSSSCDNRLGNLLVELGLVTAELLDHSVRLSMEFSISLGRVLIMSGWITGKQLQWVIQLQAFLKDGLISKDGAMQVADLMSCAGMTLQRALNCAGYPDAFSVQETRATRIGDLLVDAEIISAEQFNSALRKSQTLGMQVGRFLMIAGLVAEPLLETVCNAQRFVRENKISREDGILAIKCAAARHSDRRKSAATPIYSTMPLKTVRLGELLSLAGIVSEAHIEHAVEFGLRCNLAVGQVLMDLEIITKSTLDTALTLQDLIAQGSLDTIDAAYALIDVHHHKFTLEQALKRNRGMIGEKKSMSFEQFLTSMEVISPSQIEESIETARRSPLFVSKALVLSGAMADETVQIALLCHFYVRENMLTADESHLLFNLCQRTGISVEDGLTELGLTVRKAL